MKKITSLGFISTIVLAFGVLTFNSCTKDETDACANVTCVNGTTQTTGTVCSCNCSTGAFGSGCSETFSGLFLNSGNTTATWTITGETSNGTPVNYGDANMTFSEVSGNLTKLAITNFYGAGASSTKNLTVTDSLGTLSSGTDTLSFTSNGNTFKIYQYVGALNASKTRVTYSYQINFGTTTETAVGTLVKQ